MLNNKLCILVVDDEVKMVRAISDLLRAKGFEVLTAYDGEEALNVYYEKNTKIDLIILDVMMPKINGMEVLEDIRMEKELVPIIMLSAKGEEYDQLQGFQIGADDYITKPFSPSLLIARIENVLKRVGRDLDIVEIGKVKLSLEKREGFIGEEEIELTRREFDLLFFLMTNKNLVFSRTQLLNQIWGYEFDGDDRTVDTHVKQLRAKLKEESSIIKTVHRVGYKVEG